MLFERNGKVVKSISMSCTGLLFLILFSKYVAFGTVLLVFFISWFFYKHAIKKFPVVLFGISFLIRLAVIFMIDTPIESTFATVYEASQLFAAGDMSFSNDLFFQRFGYQTGLVIYQGLLLRIWNSVFFLQFINCLVTAGTNVLIYFIAKEFFDKKAAQSAALCYAIFVFPATFVTVLYNSQPSALFLYFGLYVMVAQRFHSMNDILRFSVAAVFFAIANALRPDAILMIVSIFVYTLMTVFSRRSKKAFFFLGKRFVILMSVYLILTFSFSEAVVHSGMNPAGLKNHDPLWNFVIGTNYSSSGSWNPQDRALIDQIMAEKGLAQNEAELQMIQDRISVSPLRLLELAKNKINVFWWERGIGWSLGHLKTDYPQLYQFAEAFDGAMFLCIFLLTGVGTAFLGIKKNLKSEIFIVLFMVVAIWFIYLMIEVQPRYAYLVQIPLFILAAGGIEAVATLIPAVFKDAKSKIT